MRRDPCRPSCCTRLLRCLPPTTRVSVPPELVRPPADLLLRVGAPSAAREVCEGIHYKRLCDVSALIAFFYSLPTWLSEHPSVGLLLSFPCCTNAISQVNLIIIDSLSSHLRPTSLDISTKNMINQLIHATLTHITSFHSVSVRSLPLLSSRT